MSYETLPEEYKRFVDSYIHCLNYRKAYQDAYPLITNADTARVNGSRLASQTEVKEAIKAQLLLYSKDKSETLQRIFQLIDFDLSDYLDSQYKVDVTKLNLSGMGWIIKGIKQMKFGTEIVLMDKDKALENLAKIHQLFDDKSTVNVNINQEISTKQKLASELSDLRTKLSEP
jgi:phage terminase small subunit